jgi:hypothetical protein
MARQVDRMYVRDCYQQVKSIRRLVLALTDDIGDLSLADMTEVMEPIQDKLTDFENWLNTVQTQLETLSRTRYLA